MVAKPALAISILIIELVMPIPMLAIYIFKFICFENNNLVDILCRNKYFEIHSIRNCVPLVIKSKNNSLYSTLNKLHLPYSFKYEHSKFKYKAKRHRTARK